MARSLLALATVASSFGWSPLSAPLAAPPARCPAVRLLHDAVSTLSAPQHVAIIPDGNSRWAAREGKSTREGHAAGARAMRAVVSECVAAPNIGTLTIYALSTENLRRERAELDWLYALFHSLLDSELDELLRLGVRLRFIGELELVPTELRKRLERAAARAPAEQSLLLCVAIGYGGTAEVARVARSLASRVRAGELEPEQVDEETFSRALRSSAHSAPSDPDLLIRCGGERRLSNFLLYQLAYTEIALLPHLWPDFTVDDFRQTLDKYAATTRRFGRRRDAVGSTR